jgi:hypothetical protein
MKFTPPAEIEAILSAFDSLLEHLTWSRVQALVCGALLCSAGTITAILRVLDLGNEPHFGSFHRVLNRAKWSAFKAAPILLGLLVKALPGLTNVAVRRAPLSEEHADVRGCGPMTSTQNDESLLKADIRGRVLVSRKRREALLDEYEKSGLSGERFARLAGICYSTFAAWR